MYSVGFERVVFIIWILKSTNPILIWCRMHRSEIRQETAPTTPPTQTDDKQANKA